VSKILVIGAAGLIGEEVVKALGESECIRTNAWTAALTVVMIALPGEGNCAARPVVSAIAPPGRTLLTP